MKNIATFLTLAVMTPVAAWAALVIVNAQEVIRAGMARSLLDAICKAAAMPII